MKKKTVKKTIRSKKATPIDSILKKDIALYQLQVYDLKDTINGHLKTLTDLRNENGALLNIIERLQTDLDVALEANINLGIEIKEQQGAIEKAVEIANQNLEISKSAVKDMLSKDNDLQLAVFNYDSLHNEYLKSKIKYDTLVQESKTRKKIFGVF